MWDDAQPTLVKLSRSAAVREGDSWRFVCASLWSGPETPPLLSVSADETWVAGTLGVAKILRNGTVEGPFPNTVSSAEVVTFASVGQTLFVQAGFSAEKSRILRIHPDGTQTEIYRPGHRIGGVAGRGANLVVVNLDANDLLLRELDVDGAEVVAPRTVARDVEGSASVRVAGQDLFIRLHNSTFQRLHRVTEDDSFPLIIQTASDEAIRGPVEGLDSRYLIVEGDLARLNSDDTLERINTEVRHTCLGYQSGLYACALPNIVAVSADGQHGERLFELANVVAPDFDALTPEQGAGCKIDWLDFAADTGLDVTPDAGQPTGAEEAPPSPEGCSAGPTSTGRGAALLMFALLAIACRRTLS